MDANVKNSNLSSSDKFRIFAAVGAAIVVIVAIAYFLFEMPAWAAIGGAFAAIFVNGLFTLLGKKSK